MGSCEVSEPSLTMMEVGGGRAESAEEGALGSSPQVVVVVDVVVGDNVQGGGEWR